MTGIAFLFLMCALAFFVLAIIGIAKLEPDAPIPLILGLAILALFFITIGTTAKRIEAVTPIFVQQTDDFTIAVFPDHNNVTRSIISRDKLLLETSTNNIVVARTYKKDWICEYEGVFELAHKGNL